MNQKLKTFYEDKENWRPPSYSQIAKFMGCSKSNAAKLVIKLKNDLEQNKNQTSGQII